MGNNLPYEIIVGVGRVYLAPVGTTFPDTDEPAGTAWTDLGCTDDDGVTVSHIREYDEHFKGCSPMVQKVTLNTARDEIAFNLAEITPTRYAKLLDDAAVTAVAAASGTPGTQYFRVAPNSTPAQYACLIRGASPLSDAEAQYEYARVSISDTVEVQYSKSDASVLSVKLTAFEDIDNPGRFGTYRAQATVAA
jgi:hypothetical protein